MILLNTWYETLGISTLISIVALLTLVSVIEWIRFDLTIKTTRKHAPTDREKLEYHDLPVGVSGRVFDYVNFDQMVIIPNDCLMFHSRWTRDIQMEHIKKWASNFNGKLKITFDWRNDEYTVWLERKGTPRHPNPPSPPKK